MLANPSAIYKYLFTIGRPGGASGFSEGDRVRILPSVANTKFSDLMCGKASFTSVGIFMRKMDTRHYDREINGFCEKVTV